mmetsp:Transcript_47937/g.95375  ORF Transcript_47937/g.95375 Transcript_47937/m.95375 type:complete len:232 (-) Transcript_47937:290-985(-)
MGACHSDSLRPDTSGCCAAGPVKLISSSNLGARRATFTGTDNSAYSKKCEAAAKLLQEREESAARNREESMLELHAAAKSGDLQLLAKHMAMPGVKLDVTDRLGSTPLHYAAKFGQAKVAAILIQAGASMETRDAEGFLPLHAAASTGRVETLRLLVDARSDVRAVDKQGNSALHLAAARSWDNNQAGRLLLDAGAEVNSQNINGYTPLACADDWGSREFTAFLRDRGGIR